MKWWLPREPEIMKQFLLLIFFAVQVTATAYGFRLLRRFSVPWGWFLFWNVVIGLGLCARRVTIFLLWAGGVDSDTIAWAKSLILVLNDFGIPGVITLAYAGAAVSFHRAWIRSVARDPSMIARTRAIAGEVFETQLRSIEEATGRIAERKRSKKIT